MAAVAEERPVERVLQGSHNSTTVYRIDNKLRRRGPLRGYCKNVQHAGSDIKEWVGEERPVERVLQVRCSASGRPRLQVEEERPEERFVPRNASVMLWKFRAFFP